MSLAVIRQFAALILQDYKNIRVYVDKKQHSFLHILSHAAADATCHRPYLSKFPLEFEMPKIDAVARHTLHLCRFFVGLFSLFFPDSTARDII